MKKNCFNLFKICLPVVFAVGLAVTLPHGQESEVINIAKATSISWA